MTQRADLYALLAELLAEPPEWMNLSAREWPLFETLTQLKAESEAARRALDLLAGIPSEGIDQRRERYAALFASGKPRFWLYESAAKTGKILGPETFEMANLYHAVGIESSGAELPDHISLELAFLSYLVERDNISLYEQQFLEKHGAWMIGLGRALVQSGDEVYAPIGALLADWLTEVQKPSTIHRPLSTVNNLLPIIPRAEDCTLCGFCVQVCPTRALKVMQNAESDFLSLNIAECIHCAKCERICNFHALKMSLPMQNAGETLVLRQSPHALCQTCGKPIASQAEMDYIVSQIGEAPWQHLCLDCRAYAIR
jgi:nitrate reductase assembly molybdenum cofactor insertion protein NarJ/NAD-dependent dihydropyrimidine dehydrogenase PreA subunit